MGTRQRLAEIARQKAQLPFHGFIDGKESNLQPIVDLFPKWNIKDADGLWCAAFVYYCCIEAGFVIPYRPEECGCSLAGCGSWEKYAIGDSRIEYHKRDEAFVPEAGDIVLYDRVFMNVEHDHIGIILEVERDGIIAAEGNTFHDNISRIVKHPIDEHVRAYIRIPDGYRYDG